MFKPVPIPAEELRSESKLSRSSRKSVTKASRAGRGLRVELGRAGLDARSRASSPSPLSQARGPPQSAAVGSALLKKKEGGLQIQPKGIVDGAVKIDLDFLERRQYTDGIDAQVERLRARARRTAAEEAVTGGAAKKNAGGAKVSIL